MLVLNRSAKSIVLSLVCLFSSGAQAAPLTLVGPTTSANAVQQTNNNLCIFGDPNCNAGGLGTIQCCHRILQAMYTRLHSLTP
jgi:hypothetical protein